MIVLSHLLGCLFVLIIIFMSILIGYVIWFGIKCRQLRHKVNESIVLVEELYIQKGINPPTMILRIQKEVIQDYNKLVGNWMGTLFHIKRYPTHEEVCYMKNDPNVSN